MRLLDSVTVFKEAVEKELTLLRNRVLSLEIVNYELLASQEYTRTRTQKWNSRRVPAHVNFDQQNDSDLIRFLNTFARYAAMEFLRLKILEDVLAPIQ